MDLLGCAEIRPRLAAYYDGELSVEGQIAIDTHVMGCAACAGDARRLEAIGRALRARTVSRNALADTAAGLAITVVSRMSAERDQSVKARVGRLFEDMHLVWAALGAVTSTACCILIDRCDDVLHRAWPDGFTRRDHDGHGLSRIQREPRAARSEHPSAPRSPGGDRTGDAGRPTSWRQWRI